MMEYQYILFYKGNRKEFFYKLYNIFSTYNIGLLIEKKVQIWDEEGNNSKIELIDFFDKVKENDEISFQWWLNNSTAEDLFCNLKEKHFVTFYLSGVPKNQKKIILKSLLVLTEELEEAILFHIDEETMYKLSEEIREKLKMESIDDYFDERKKFLKESSIDFENMDKEIYIIRKKNNMLSKYIIL